jgi:predicted acylesterase/phospholipase RssA
VFPPIFADDAVHIDGGLVNNLPTDIIRGMGVGFVLAVDVGAGPASGNHAGACLGSLSASASTFAAATARLHQKLTPLSPH